ncbi:MAG: ABC transporter ATP-binding protein [Acidobacteriota bacterium]
MTSPAITIDRFTHRYGRTVAVDHLDLEVPAGTVVGLVGQNGAGKTTTIHALLNLIQPTAGRLSVFGLDTVADARRVREQVGYVAETPDLYPWMRVDELLRFSSAFHSTWDPALAEELTRRLALPRTGRIGQLSRGTRTKVALVTALAHRPKLLLLDDPTSGLDPIVRRSFMEEILRTVQAEGGTILFSSHLLHEMERVADEVAVLHEGRLLCRSSLESLKAGVKQLRATFEDSPPPDLALPGLLRRQIRGRQAILTVREFTGAVAAELRRAGPKSIEVLHLPLEEIFVEIVHAAGGPAPVDADRAAPVMTAEPGAFHA